MRLAWFSPMPPVRSGIATYSAELIDGLRRDHQIDIFVDQPNSVRPTGDASGRSAHDFVWMHQQRPYDLTVYQVGNSSHHDFLWPYLFRYPGLTVLHDAHLHHARAAHLLRERRQLDYRAEFHANQPELSVDAAELAVRGFDSFLYYDAPFTRLVCTASRMTVVHGRLIRDELRSALPEARVEHVRPAHGTPVSSSDALERGARARQRHGIPASAMLFGCFGGLTPEKRIPQILAAFESVLRYAPSAWLLLAGAEADHYDVGRDVRHRGLESRVVIAGYLESDDDLTDCISASDVTLNLRWPTAREMSGAWLRCLAAGRSTVVIDLSHVADVPALDPRTWKTHVLGDERPVAVAIDIVDEDHSLRHAMRRLASDPALRETLGQAGREFWIREHSPSVMFDDYRRLLADAAAAPVPQPPLPTHLRGNNSDVMRAILGEFGVSVPWSTM